MNKRYFKIANAILPVLLALGCRQQPTQPATPEEHLAEGSRLAHIYCASCHRFPEPALADKASWERGILPAMAKKLNMQQLMGQYYADEHSVLGTSQWLDVVNWYKSQAPDTLAIPKPPVPPLRDWAGFTLTRPKGYNRDGMAMTTSLSINPLNGQLYTADAGNAFYQWDAGFKPKLLKQFTSPVTDIQVNGDNLLLTCIGSLMPVDVLNGQVLSTTLAGLNKPSLIADSLPRPVQTVAADFNKDGLTDYVTCGFGHDRGALYLMQQRPARRFVKSILWPEPGATMSFTGDYNHDGWPDVMTLFAQADEGIVLFLNNHKGGFSSKRLLRFPPIYGSSSFQLVDMNHDGNLDIVYTAGDNSDYSKVLKPYHGVYIFLNEGNWKLKQEYFYHIDGASKAIAADFDGDGDTDIATVSFFSDFKYHPAEGFVYLEQTAPLKFTVHEPPVDPYGRWITLTAGDVNHDGKPDLILANFSIGQRGLLNQKGFAPQWDMHEPFIVLTHK